MIVFDDHADGKWFLRETHEAFSSGPMNTTRRTSHNEGLGTGRHSSGGAPAGTSPQGTFATPSFAPLDLAGACGSQAGPAPWARGCWRGGALTSRRPPPGSMSLSTSVGLCPPLRPPQLPKGSRPPSGGGRETQGPKGLPPLGPSPPPHPRRTFALRFALGGSRAALELHVELGHFVWRDLRRGGSPPRQVATGGVFDDLSRDCRVEGEPREPGRSGLSLPWAQPVWFGSLLAYSATSAGSSGGAVVLRVARRLLREFPRVEHEDISRGGAHTCAQVCVSEVGLGRRHRPLSPTSSHTRLEPASLFEARKRLIGEV